MIQVRRTLSRVVVALILILGLALALLAIGVTWAAVASAQTPTPTCEVATEAAVDAKADVDAALPALLEFAPADYPDGTLPALDDLTPPYLDRMLHDSNLGEGAKAAVTAVVDLHAKLAAALEVKAAACAPPPTTTPNPTTTPAPTDDPDPTTTPRPTTTPADEDDDPVALPADNDPDDQFTYRPRTTRGIATGGVGEE